MSDLHAQTAPFVRDTMLPPDPPPAMQSGAVKWLRENLFSGWLNTLLTIAGLAAILFLVQKFLPWFLHSVWDAGSITECRAIIEERWGPGAEGACWAVIRERWPQFLYGFYPAELYWRPVLAFGLLLIAIGPILFTQSQRAATIFIALIAALTVVSILALGQYNVLALVFVAALVAVQVYAPRRLMIFTLLYPAVGFWLLWGGSVWVPVVAVLGFVLGWLAFSLVQPRGGSILAVVAAVLVPTFWWLFAAGPVAGALQGVVPLGIEAVRSDRFGGFVLALTIGVTGIAFSLPIGIILALGRRSDMFLVKTLCVGFIEFIRGVPLITLLFTASLLLNYFLPPGTNFDIILRVIIMVTLFASAYIAEVIRGGLAALPRGQYEAADALGLDYWKAQRLIIMPQALKISIPGIVSSFIGLFKDTTLVIFVGLLDPLKGITDAVRASIEWKGAYWEPYIFVGVIFWIICFSMSRYSMYLERLLKREHR
ncbi:MAG: amino acid ABC transporter permease [Albidovulum sp.]|uniref:amino acid ABC transporter permease n=1 Tax=Albidovulum sp. TaxID=1872424 RepID=UPI001329E11A|nr:amino acid ABC transporter permease [Defluviimonas sp.]KAB2884670.1 MAG: amino acid ABC transporter permease [Defluviimonas sp.]